MNNTTTNIPIYMYLSRLHNKRIFKTPDSINDTINDKKKHKQRHATADKKKTAHSMETVYNICHLPSNCQAFGR